MAIVFKSGNILESQAQFITNPVNCVGVMGKGLALEFKNHFGDTYFFHYKKACQASQLRLGRIHVYHFEGTKEVRGIINFPTKHHWRDYSDLKSIDEGLQNLAEYLAATPVIQSIAFPRLGSGLGRLAWPEVRKLIIDRLGALNATIEVYE